MKNIRLFLHKQCKIYEIPRGALISHLQNSFYTSFIVCMDLHLV